MDWPVIRNILLIAILGHAQSVAANGKGIGLQQNPFEDQKLHDYYAKEYLASMENSVDPSNNSGLNAGNLGLMQSTNATVYPSTSPMNHTILSWLDQEVPGYLPPPTGSSVAPIPNTIPATYIPDPVIHDDTTNVDSGSSNSQSAASTLSSAEKTAQISTTLVDNDKKTQPTGMVNGSDQLYNSNTPLFVPMMSGNGNTAIAQQNLFRPEQPYSAMNNPGLNNIPLLPSTTTSPSQKQASLSLGSIIGMLKNAYANGKFTTPKPLSPPPPLPPPVFITPVTFQVLPPHVLFPANIEPRYPYYPPPAPATSNEHIDNISPDFAQYNSVDGESANDDQLQNVLNENAAVSHPQQQQQQQQQMPPPQIQVKAATHRPYNLQITPLVIGALQPISGGFVMTASVTLLQDDALNVLVDTPAATDFHGVGKMIEGFRKANVRTDQVDILVTTHGHPDHSGFANMFPNARHHFGLYEYSSNAFVRTELYENETMPLTMHSDLWTTPGHTTSDVSLIVKSVPKLGTVAITGDLFYSEADVLEPTAWLAGAVDGRGLHFRNKVLCTANYIVPGHGPMFRVTETMRPARMQCDELLRDVVEDE